MLTIAVQLMCKLSTQHVHVYESIVHSMLCSTCIMKKVLYGIVQFKILHRYMRSLQNSFMSKMMTEFQIWIYCCILKHLIHKPNTPGNRNNIIQIHTHTYCKFARKKKKRFLKQYLCCNHGYILAKGKNYSYFIDRKIQYFYLKLCM